MFGILPVKINFIVGILSEMHKGKKKVTDKLFWSIE